MNDLERRLLAYHEASHGVMALSLGMTVAAITIRPAPGRHLGAMIHDPPPRVAERKGPFGISASGLRREVEDYVRVCLAGQQGELLIPHSGFADSSDVDDALAHLRTLDVGAKPSTMTERERNALAIAETRPVDEVIDDESAVLLRETALTDDGALAAAHLGWLRVETARRVFDPAFRAVVDALVPALLEREVLGGIEARAIYEEVTKMGTTADERQAELDQMQREDQLLERLMNGSISRVEYEERLVLVSHENEVWR